MIDTIDSSVPVQQYEAPTEESSTGTWWEGASAAWDLADIEYGEGYHVKARQKLAETNPDYQKHKKYLDRWVDNSDYLASEGMENTSRSIVEQGIDSGRFTLDKNGDVVDSKKTWASDWLIDYDLVKGSLLAKQYGFDNNAVKASYQTIVNEEKASLQEVAADNSLGQTITGIVGSFVSRPEFVKEVAASPAKVMGTSILSGATKAFGAEFTAAALGEFDREQHYRKHKDMMDEEYTLWDSTLNIIQNSAFAGVFRAGGSAISDKWLLKGIKEEVEKSAKLEAEIIKMEGKQAIRDKSVGIAIDGADREVLNRFVRREEYKLAQDTNLHIDMAYKAEYDINKGDKADIESHADVDGDEKFNTKDIEETNLEAEVKNEYTNIDDAVEEIQKEVDETQPAMPASKEDPYAGMASKADGDEAIKEEGFGEEFDDIDAQIAEIEARKTGEVDTGSDEYGKEIEEMEATTKADTKFQAQIMTINGVEIPKTQFDLIQKYQKNRKWNRDNPANKRQIPQSQQDAYTKYSDVADDIQDIEFMQDTDLADDFGNPIFAKFADNLAAGTVAGVEMDEEGNITFDPEKFVLGLGGYTVAKQAIRYANRNGAITKEISEYAERQLDNFEARRISKLFTGIHKIEDDSGHFFRGTKTPEHTKTDTGVIWYAKDSDIANAYAAGDEGFKEGSTVTMAKISEDAVLFDAGSMTRKTSAAEFIMDAINQSGIKVKDLDSKTSEFIKGVIKDNIGKDDALYQLIYNDPRIIDALKMLDYDGISGLEGMGGFMGQGKSGSEFTIGVFDEKHLEYKNAGSNKPIVKSESGVAMNENLESQLKTLKEKFKEAGVKNFVYENSSGEITLSSIQIEKAERSKGLGTKYMKELIEIADKNDKIIVLSPSSDFGGSKARLTKFYKGFGFVKNKDYRFKETMIRKPKDN